MKKLTKCLRASWMITAFLLVMSCNVTTNMDDIERDRLPTNESLISRDGRMAQLTSVSSLNRVDLHLSVGYNITGTVTVQIRNFDGSTVIGSTTVAASSLTAGSNWNAFTFSPALSLNPAEKYRIYLIRSDEHNNSTDNTLFWRTSSGGVDAYPGGINSTHPSWTLDFSFITYNQGVVDQQQTLTNYGFGIGNTDYHWQEFVPAVPKVVLTYVDLNLSVGTGTTGTLTVQIRSADGSTVIAQHTVPRSALPNGTNWVRFKFGAELIKDQPYRIYVTRSDAHNNFTQNTIFWKTSSGGVNAYPDGINDVYPSWTLDYAFRTYSSVSGLDQQQNLNTYGFFLGNSFYRWQGFIPRNQ